MKKKLLLLTVLVMVFVCLLVVSASAVETIDGITYDFSGNPKTARVTNANQSCTLEYVVIPETVTASDGNTYTVTEIYENAFNNNDTIKFVSLPNTITFMASKAFYDCDNLVFVDFNDNPNDINWGNYANGHFRSCDNLKAICFSNGITKFENGLVTDCNNLEVVYLPTSLTRINGNKYGDGAFDDCKSMYFTNTKFDTDDFLTDGKIDMDKYNQNKPVKEDIYFFPNNLTTMGNTQDSPTFTFCTNLNSTLVFPVSFNATGLSPDGDLLNIGTATSPKKVVFLGDMEGFCAQTQNNRQDYISFYFMNPADTDPSKIGIGGYSNSATPKECYLYFCLQGKYYKWQASQTYSEAIEGTAHIANPNKSTIVAPTCITQGYTEGECFCTAKMDKVYTDPTGVHIYKDDNNCTTADPCGADENCTAVSEKQDSHALVHTLDYANGFDKVGVYNHNCTNNGCTKVIDTDDDGIADSEIIDQESPAIIKAKGWSTPEKGDYIGINAGYEINSTLLKKYEALNDDEVTLGLFIVGVDSVKSVGAILGADCEIVKNVMGFKVSVSSDGYSDISIEIRGFTQGDDNTGSYYTLNLISAMYVKTKDGVKYIQSTLADDTDTNRVTITEGTFNTVSADRIYTSVANQQ